VSKWTVILGKGVENRISKIPKQQRDRIFEALLALAQNPYESNLDVKPLQGRPEWRLRVGAWRVLFRVDGVRITITVVKVGSRGDVYK
jgi:mRNA interferase RelE/StbE